MPHFAAPSDARLGYIISTYIKSVTCLIRLIFWNNPQSKTPKKDQAHETYFVGHTQEWPSNHFQCANGDHDLKLNFAYLFSWQYKAFWLELVQLHLNFFLSLLRINAAERKEKRRRLKNFTMAIHVVWKNALIVFWKRGTYSYAIVFNIHAALLI